MSDKKTIEIYDARAQTYADLVARQSPDADLQSFIDAVRPGGRVLDLGCGPGNSAAMMKSAGLIADAMDASTEMVRLARDIHGVSAQHARFDDLSGSEIYDGIWANFSLLHAPKADLPRHLAAIKTALKPGGVFHIGMKLDEKDGRDGIGRLYSYYSIAELDSLLESAGLIPRTHRTGRDKGLSGEMSDYVIILCDG